VILLSIDLGNIGYQQRNLPDMIKTSIIETLFVALLLATPAAQAVVLDFEDFGLVDFTHGTVVDDEYAPGVTISATGGVNKAVAFDTSTAVSATSDDDLLNPFSGPLSSNFDPGNILIIQENNTGCSVGTCSDPDDVGARPAGKLIFEFTSIVEILSLDFFDIENVTGNNENSDQTGSEIRFFDKFDGELFAGDYFVPGTGGNNTWDRLFFTGVTGVSKLEVNLAGSGGIDRLSYSVVPVPAAVWLFGTALLGFIGFSRRTAI
jgi:hypothetical protein